MSSIFSVLATDTTWQANLFALQLQQSPSQKVQQVSLQTLAADIKTVEKEITFIDNAVLTVYGQNARLISFDQQLGRLLGITV